MLRSRIVVMRIQLQALNYNCCTGSGVQNSVLHRIYAAPVRELRFSAGQIPATFLFNTHLFYELILINVCKYL
jgi:hypothetical protein